MTHLVLRSRHSHTPSGSLSPASTAASASAAPSRSQYPSNLGQPREDPGASRAPLPPPVPSRPESYQSYLQHDIASEGYAPPYPLDPMITTTQEQGHWVGSVGGLGGHAAEGLPELHRLSLGDSGGYGVCGGGGGHGHGHGHDACSHAYAYAQPSHPPPQLSSYSAPTSSFAPRPPLPATPSGHQPQHSSYATVPNTYPSYPPPQHRPPLPTPPPPPVYTPSTMPPSSPSHRLSIHSVHSTTSTNSSASGPRLTAALPTIEHLRAAQPGLDRLSAPDQLAWAEDCLRLVDKHTHPGVAPTEFLSPTVPPGVQLPRDLDALLVVAAPVVISLTTHPAPEIAATATFLRGKLLASGACAELLPRDQRQAFRDFEVAAKSGEHRAWYRLGRDYEGVGDLGRARECFEKGRSKGDCESTYRMGMAHLLGQLHLSPDPATALPLLQHASTISTTDFPTPAYVYGLLLSGDLSTPVPIPSSILLPSTPHHTASGSAPPSDALLAQHQSARDAIEHAAHLGLAPAQHKAGYLYEHAALGSAYDPLMSVQWYSLASQAGDVEADMALSKWFLCGAEGHFAKNEELARTFAEKAARKGHPNGCFAMGYYYELGIGGRQDHEQAKKWYQRASKLNNADAVQRLAALTSSTPQALSLLEHQSKLNETLVRRHTQAKIRSDRTSVRRPPPARGASKVARADAARIDAAARAAAAATPYTAMGVSSLPSMPSMPSQGLQVGQIFSPNPGVSPGQGGFSMASAYPQPHPTGGNAGERARRPSRPQVVIPGAAPSPSPSSPGGAAPGARRSSHSAGNGNGTPLRSYALKDSSAANLPASNSVQSVQLRDPGVGGVAEAGQGMGQARGKGPQTFAEMGFVSKPVEEDGCVIM